MEKDAGLRSAARSAGRYLRRSSRSAGRGAKRVYRSKAFRYGGLAAGGAAGGMAAARFAPRVQSHLALRKRKAVAAYKDKTKSVIVWRTFPGGPILEGPSRQMIELFKTGKRDKKAGVVMLAQLMKSGTIRKTGTVT